MASLYIHIPFCKRRCIYCDFYSTVKKEESIKEYLQCIEKEFSFRKKLLDEPIDTIYLGGGTPSLLKKEDLDFLFSSLMKDSSLFSKDIEITMEANPEQLSKDYISFLSNNTPINRLSIGVQSFDDNQLKFLNRRHTSLQAKTAISTAQEAGFKNISIDLIFSLPQMSLEDWERNLSEAVGCSVQHLSVYCLTVEEGTMLSQMIANGKIVPLEEEKQLEQFDFAMRFLSEHGFEHYETSNYALKGFRSRHNSAYWNGISYIGLGASAHSYYNNERWWNVADADLYIKNIKSGSPLITKEYLSQKDLYNEYILTHSRIMKGISKEKISKDFCEFYPSFIKATEQLIEQNLLVFNSKTGYYTLTLAGWHLQDMITETLFSVK